MTASANVPASAGKKSFIDTLELDTRLLGMVVAFVVLTIGFHIFTGGLFLTPRNIFNLTIQTVSVAIMATGMVFVIVLRDIDLSVGSLLCLCSAVMGLVQVQFMPDLGIALGSPLIAPVAIVAGLLVGALVGAFNGWLIGYLSVPSFIVTLGGLLVWRNVAWYFTSGQTLGPLDENFQLFGGINGTLGAPPPSTACSRAVAAGSNMNSRSSRCGPKRRSSPSPSW